MTLKKNKFTKFKIIIYIISCVILFTIGYNITIPLDNDKNIITEGQFNEIMKYNDFVISYNYSNNLDSANRDGKFWHNMVVIK